MVACLLCPLVISASPSWWSPRRSLACQLNTGPQTTLKVLPGPGRPLHPPPHHSWGHHHPIPSALFIDQRLFLHLSLRICWNLSRLSRESRFRSLGPASLSNTGSTTSDLESRSCGPAVAAEQSNASKIKTFCVEPQGFNSGMCEI